MVRRFVTLDGEVLADEFWSPNPTHRCFWCDDHLAYTGDSTCYDSFDGNHEWVTVCNREYV